QGRGSSAATVVLNLRRSFQRGQIVRRDRQRMPERGQRFFFISFSRKGDATKRPELRTLGVLLQFRLQMLQSLVKFPGPQGRSNRLDPRWVHLRKRKSTKNDHH